MMKMMAIAALVLSMTLGAGPATRPTTRLAMPSTLPAGTAVEAVQGYLRAVRAGYPAEAVAAYLDSFALLDLVSGTGADVKLAGDERQEAAADIRLIIEGSWQVPGLAEMMRTSELSIKGSKAGADGLTQIDYVLTLTQPRRVELPNTMYLHKTRDEWRIVDMNQPNQPRMSEALRNGYTLAKKVDPSAKLEPFLFDLMRSVRRKAAGPATGATTRPSGGATTRPVGR